MKKAFNLHQFAEIVKSLFQRLFGGNGSTVFSGSTSGTGRWYTIYVAADATFTSITGGGEGAATWTTTLPAGSTLTASMGVPITALTITSGTIICY
jgi:hypothetical protein